MSGTTYFEAQARHADGSVKTRLVFAQTAMQARKELAADGLMVLSLKQRKDSRLNREFYTSNYVIGFFEGLLYRLQVGEGPAMAMVQHIQSEPNKKKRSEMQRAIDVLERGGSFPDAMAALPFVSREVAAIAEASDAGGEIRHALTDIVDLLRAKKKSWGLAVGAFTWLSLDLGTIISAVFGIQFVALPWLRNNPPQVKDAATIAEFNSSLELISYASTAITVLTCVFIVAVVVLGCMSLFSGRKAKERAQQLAMSVPLIRDVYVHAALASGMLLLSRLSGRGVPLQRSLELLASSTAVLMVSNYWFAIKNSINAGLGLNEAVGARGLLQDNEVAALRAQRNRAQFSQVLGAIATARQKQAEGAVQNLVRAGVVATIAYMALAMGLGLWMLILQNDSVTGSFEQLMKGGY
jgi:type II secretory pathway component PulF